MVDEVLPARLAARLARPLPSWAVQSRFQPELSFGRHRGPAESTARPAAVLALLYPHQERWHIPLILRPAHMLDHAGQVSLPGGVIEVGESSSDAALREYAEELGAASEEVQLLGQLSGLYLFASNFRIEPWLGVLDHRPQWQPNAREVERVLEVPLDELLDPQHVGTFERRQGPVSFVAPCFRLDAECVWGATSMVLAELAAILTDL